MRRRETSEELPKLDNNLFFLMCFLCALLIILGDCLASLRLFSRPQSTTADHCKEERRPCLNLYNLETIRASKIWSTTKMIDFKF